MSDGAGGVRLVARRFLLGVLAAALAWTAISWPRVPAAERGRRLAETEGCFTCHGPGGLKGAMNPGRKDKSVPGFTGDVMMYAHDETDLREWIRDGVPKRRAESHTWREQRDAGTMRMPAFGLHLSSRAIDDLVAYVRASASDPEVDDPLASQGLRRAEALGCVGCHGPGGRLAALNPGSFKGYIPSWEGDDFAELVRDRGEFDGWVRDGISKRMRENAVASFFLGRSSVHMPAFEQHLEPGDLEALWAYVTWMRKHPLGA